MTRALLALLGLAKRPVSHVVGLALLCLAVYLPSFDNELLWDDRMMLLDSSAMAAPNAVSRALTSAYLSALEDAASHFPYYRPVTLALLALERRAFGEDPLGYRVAHTLLHLANVLLLYLLAARLLRRSRMTPSDAGRQALFAAALFALLPYCVDAVCFLTDLGSLLCAACFLASLLLFDVFLRTGRLAALLSMVLAAAIGIGSKETGIAIPAVLAAFFAFFHERRALTRAVAAVGSSLAPCAAYLAMRSLALDLPRGFDCSLAAARFFADLACALRWAIAPHPLALEIPLAEAPGAALTVAGAVLLVLGAAAAYLGRRHLAPASFGLAAWFLTLCPSMLILHNFLVFASRYLYIPGLWLALGVGMLAPLSSRVKAIGAVGVLVALALLTVIRVDAWNDDVSLWATEVERNPDRPYARVQLALALEHAGRIEEARALHREAIAMAHTPRETSIIATAHACLGHDSSERLGDPSAALAHYHRALELVPTSLDAWIGVGNVHARDGSWDKALAAFDRGARNHPDSVKALASRAGALAALGRFDEALATLDQAARIASGSPRRLKDIARKRTAIEKLRSDRRKTPSPRPTNLP